MKEIEVKYSSIINLKFQIGLAIISSACLLVMGAKSTITESQAELFTPKTPLSSVNKITGLPEPGSYTLQKIFSIPELSVLDTKGNSQPISKYTKGKITLLTFFYDRCSDANGCPYAIGLFHKVKGELERDKHNLDNVRLVNISFDPERDTPMMMAGLEKKYSGRDKKKKHLEWKFLTTKSVNDLMPLVDGFGQNVDINVNSITNNRSLTYSHVLKVFLIDSEGYVREIYSTAYISKQMLLNDIRTLASETTTSSIAK
jgi:protein SCO1/2